MQIAGQVVLKMKFYAPKNLKWEICNLQSFTIFAVLNSEQNGIIRTRNPS